MSDQLALEVDRACAVLVVERRGGEERTLRVGNNVWMGYGACVLRGVTIGDNAIVGTSSVVTKDVPDNAVVAGIPATLLRMRAKPRRLRWR